MGAVQAGFLEIIPAKGLIKSKARSIERYETGHIGETIAICVQLSHGCGITVLVQILRITDFGIAGETIGVGVITICPAAACRLIPVTIIVGTCAIANLINLGTV